MRAGAQPVRAHGGRALAARGASPSRSGALYGAALRPGERDHGHRRRDPGALHRRDLALVQPGDEVVVSNRATTAYVPVVRLAGGKAVRASLSPPGYRSDWDADRGATLAPHPDDPGQLARTTPPDPYSPRGPGCAGRPAARHRHRRALRRGLRAHRLRRRAPRERLAAPGAGGARPSWLAPSARRFHATGWKVGYALRAAELTAEIRRVHQFVVFAVNTPIQLAHRRLRARTQPAYDELPAFYQRKRDLFRGRLAGHRAFGRSRARAPTSSCADYAASATSPTGRSPAPARRARGRLHSAVSAFHADGRQDRVLRFCFAKRDETLDRGAGAARDALIGPNHARHHPRPERHAHLRRRGDAGRASPRPATPWGFGKATVSRRIRALERRLGVRLVLRTTRQVSLTDAGRAFLERCLRIEDEISDAEAAVRRLGSGPRGTLRVSAPFSLARALLLPFLPDFLRQHPEVRVALTLKNEPEDLVGRGAEVALTPWPLPPTRHATRLVGTMVPRLYASPAYLERRGRPKTPHDLTEPPHPALRRGRRVAPGSPGRSPAGRRTESVPLFPALVSNDYAPLHAAALAGVGVVGSTRMHGRGRRPLRGARARPPGVDRRRHRGPGGLPRAQLPLPAHPRLHRDAPLPRLPGPLARRGDGRRRGHPAPRKRRS